MTDDKIALRALLEKGSDASIPARDDRLCRRAPDGVGDRDAVRRRARRAQRRADQPAQRLSRPRLAYPGRHRRAADPEAAPRQLLSRLPRAAPHGREGADGGHPGGLHPGHLDPLGRRPGQGARHGGHQQEPGLAPVRARSTSACTPSSTGRSKAIGPMSGSTPPT